MTQAQDYIKTLKPEENATGTTMLPNGEIVEVEPEKAWFWDTVKEWAKEWITWIFKVVWGAISDWFSAWFGDIDKVQNAFEWVKFNGKDVDWESNNWDATIKTYYNNLKIIDDFEKNWLNTIDDINKYNAAKWVLSQFDFKDKEKQKVIKDLINDGNIISRYELNWDEEGNGTANTWYRIIRHWALQEEIQNATTSNFVSDVKKKIAQKLVDNWYQANNNPWGRVSTLDEVITDLDSSFQTIWSLQYRLQAYMDVINATEKTDYQTAKEYKRLTEGLVDMVGYILNDNTWRSSQEIMQEYITKVWDPMAVNTANMKDAKSATADANLVKALSFWTTADAYQTALLIKDRTAMGKNLENIKKWEDVALNAAWLVLNALSAGASTVSGLVNWLNNVPAWTQYLCKKYFNDTGYKEWRWYDMDDYASYFYARSDSGIANLKSRVQKWVEDSQDWNDFQNVLNKYWSSIDDIFTAVEWSKKLSLDFKKAKLVNSWINTLKKVEKTAEVTKQVTDTVLKEWEQIVNIVKKWPGFLKSVADKTAQLGKWLYNYFISNPIQETKIAWKEFKLLWGKWFNLQKASYVWESLMRWIWEETLQSAYFNWLTSQPYTDKDFYADMFWSLLSAYDRAWQFNSSFISMAHAPENTKWAVFWMKELLKMDDSDIERVLKKSQTSPELLNEIWESVSSHAKKLIDDTGIASAKTVRSAAANLTSDVRSWLQKKIDDMVLKHDQTFMKALYNSSDIRHNWAVKEVKDKNWNVSYKWADWYDETKVSKLKKRSVQEWKDKAYEDIFAPKPEKWISRILQLKKLVTDNLALYCASYFKDSVERVNGKIRFKSNVTKEKKKLFFRYIMTMLLKREWLDRTDQIKRAIEYNKRTAFWEARLGKEVETEAGVLTMSKYTNLYDRMLYFINTMAIHKQQRTDWYLHELVNLWAWAAEWFKWWCSKYKHINDPEKIDPDELKKLLLEYGKMFDESIKSEYLEEVRQIDAVDIRGSIANKTYEDACKENKNLVNMDVETFWYIIDSDLPDAEKHRVLKEYKKHDNLYKDKIINVENKKPDISNIDNCVYFNNLIEERATLWLWWYIYIPTNWYSKEKWQILMDYSKDNSEVYVYSLEKTKKEWESTYLVQKKINHKYEKLWKIHTQKVWFWDNPERIVMWFEPAQWKDFKLEYFRLFGKRKSRSLAETAIPQKKKIELDPTKFKKEKNKVEEVPEDITLTESDWAKVMSNIKNKSDYRKFVDESNRFVSYIISKKIYKDIIGNKKFTDSDKFKVISDLISLGKSLAAWVPLKWWFLNWLSDITKQYVLSTLKDSYVSELKISWTQFSPWCIIKKNDDWNINVYDIYTKEIIGKIYTNWESSYVIVNWTRKEIESFRPVKEFDKNKLDKDTESETWLDLEKLNNNVVNERKDILDYSKKFFEEAWFRNFEDTLNKIYGEWLTKEEVIKYTLDNIDTSSTFFLRAVNKFKSFYNEWYKDPDVLWRKLKYELGMAKECEIYKNNHKNNTLEDVELHKCMERYDEIKNDWFILNGSERDFANILFGKERSHFTRDELISVIWASLFNKPQNVNTKAKLLMKKRNDNLIQILTWDPDSINWPEEVKLNFLQHTKEYLDIINKSIDEISWDIEAHPERYYDLLKNFADEFRRKEDNFDITKDVKKRDELERKLNKLRKEYNKLKKKRNTVSFKEREWKKDTNFYSKAKQRYQVTIDMCDEVIDDLRTEIYWITAGFDEASKEYFNSILKSVEFEKEKVINDFIERLRREFELNGIPQEPIDKLEDFIDFREQSVKLLAHTQSLKSGIDSDFIKEIVNDWDLDRLMLQTLTGQWVLNSATMTRKQFDSVMSQIKDKIKRRQYTVVWANGVIEFKNLRDREINSMMKNFIIPKSKSILEWTAWWSTNFSNSLWYWVTNILYHAENQNIVWVWHEWFHSVVHTVMTDEDIKRTEELLDHTYQKYKWLIDEQASHSKYRDKYEEATKNIEDMWYISSYERFITEEWLADRFWEYVAGKLKLNDNEIIRFFKMIWERIQTLLDPEILQYFDDIYNNRLSSVISQRDNYLISPLRVWWRKKYVNTNSAVTLDKIISPETSETYANNPIAITSDNTMEQLRNLFKSEDFKTSLFALSGKWVGRLPSVMWVDWKSFMTEMHKVINNSKNYIDVFTETYNQLIANNIEQIKANMQLPYSETFAWWLKVKAYEKDWKLNIVSSVRLWNWFEVKVGSYRWPIVEWKVEEVISPVNWKLSIEQVKNVMNSYVKTNWYINDIKDIPDIVYKSVAKNVKKNPKEEYFDLERSVISAVNDCYNYYVYNIQIPHQWYDAYSKEAYYNLWNPLEDYAYYPLEMKLWDAMFLKKSSLLENIINKYQGVDWIKLSKYIDEKWRPWVYAEIDVWWVNVTFSFHTDRNFSQTVSYQSLPDNIWIRKNVSWNQYPLSISRKWIFDIYRKEWEQIDWWTWYTQKIYIANLLNWFNNAIVSNNWESIWVIGKKRVHSNWVDAIVLYDWKKPKEIDWEWALMYFTPNSKDADKISYMLEEKWYSPLLVDLDKYRAWEVEDVFSNFKKWKNILVLTWWEWGIWFKMFDNNYLDNTIREANVKTLTPIIYADVSMDKEVISSLEELDKIDLALRRRYAELRRLAKRKRAIKRSMNIEEPTKVEETTKTLDEVNNEISRLRWQIKTYTDTLDIIEKKYERDMLSVEGKVKQQIEKNKANEKEIEKYNKDINNLIEEYWLTWNKNAEAALSSHPRFEKAKQQIEKLQSEIVDIDLNREKERIQNEYIDNETKYEIQIAEANGEIKRLESDYAELLELNSENKVMIRPDTEWSEIITDEKIIKDNLLKLYWDEKSMNLYVDDEDSYNEFKDIFTTILSAYKDCQQRYPDEIYLSKGLENKIGNILWILKDEKTPIVSEDKEADSKVRQIRNYSLYDFKNLVWQLYTVYKEWDKSFWVELPKKVEKMLPLVVRDEYWNAKWMTNQDAYNYELNRDSIIEWYTTIQNYNKYEDIDPNTIKDIWKWILSKDKSIHDANVSTMTSLLTYKITDIVLDYMKDKLTNSVKFWDLMQVAWDEVYNMLSRVWENLINKFISWEKNINDYLTGEKAIWWWKNWITGIEDRLKNEYDNLLWKWRKKEEVAFAKYIENKAKELSEWDWQLKMAPDLKFDNIDLWNDVNDPVRNAFILWLNSKYIDQLSHTKNKQKAKENVLSQLIKAFPESEYPELYKDWKLVKITVDDVRWTLSWKQLSLDAKAWWDDSEWTTSFGDTIKWGWLNVDESWNIIHEEDLSKELKEFVYDSNQKKIKAKDKGLSKNDPERIAFNEFENKYWWQHLKDTNFDMLTFLTDSRKTIKENYGIDIASKYLILKDLKEYKIDDPVKNGFILWVNSKYMDQITYLKEKRIKEIDKIKKEIKKSIDDLHKKEDEINEIVDIWYDKNVLKSDTKKRREKDKKWKKAKTVDSTYVKKWWWDPVWLAFKKFENKYWTHRDPDDMTQDIWNVLNKWRLWLIENYWIDIASHGLSLEDFKSLWINIWTVERAIWDYYFWHWDLPLTVKKHFKIEWEFTIKDRVSDTDDKSKWGIIELYNSKFDKSIDYSFNDCVDKIKELKKKITENKLTEEETNQLYDTMGKYREMAVEAFLDNMWLDYDRKIEINDPMDEYLNINIPEPIKLYFKEKNPNKYDKDIQSLQREIFTRSKIYVLLSYLKDNELLKSDEIIYKKIMGLVKPLEDRYKYWQYVVVDRSWFHVTSNLKWMLDELGLSNIIQHKPLWYNWYELFFEDNKRWIVEQYRKYYDGEFTYNLLAPEDWKIEGTERENGMPTTFGNRWWIEWYLVESWESANLAKKMSLKGWHYPIIIDWKNGTVKQYFDIYPLDKVEYIVVSDTNKFKIWDRTVEIDFDYKSTWENRSAILDKYKKYSEAKENKKPKIIKAKEKPKIWKVTIDDSLSKTKKQRDNIKLIEESITQYENMLNNVEWFAKYKWTTVEQAALDIKNKIEEFKKDLEEASKKLEKVLNNTKNEDTKKISSTLWEIINLQLHKFSVDWFKKEWIDPDNDTLDIATVWSDKYLIKDYEPIAMIIDKKKWENKDNEYINVLNNSERVPLYLRKDTFWWYKIWPATVRNIDEMWWVTETDRRFNMEDLLDETKNNSINFITKFNASPLLIVDDIDKFDTSSIQFSNYSIPVKPIKDEDVTKIILAYIEENDWRREEFEAHKEREENQKKKKNNNYYRDDELEKEEREFYREIERERLNKLNEERQEQLKKEKEEFHMKNIKEIEDNINNLKAEENETKEYVEYFKKHFTESTWSYKKRTEENAENSDITLAIACDFNTAWERLTKNVAGNKYVSYDISKWSDNSPLNVVNNIKEQITKQWLPTENITLNIAGNGIYTFKGKYKKMTQSYLNNYITNVITELLNQWITIKKIISWWQSWVDEAWIRAAINLDIDWEVHGPKWFVFRDEHNKDIFDKDKFIMRFLWLYDDYKMPDVIDNKLWTTGKWIRERWEWIPLYRIKWWLDWNPEHHFGNPFSPVKYPWVVVKTKNIKECVENYKKWLLWLWFNDVAQERRKFVIEQIKKYHWEPIYYYTEKADLWWETKGDIEKYDPEHPNHAMVFKKVVDLLDSWAMYIDDDWIIKLNNPKYFDKKLNDIQRKIYDEENHLENYRKKNNVGELSLDKKVSEEDIEKVLNQDFNYKLWKFEKFNLFNNDYIPDFTKRINISDNVYTPKIKIWLDDDFKEAKEKSSEYKTKYKNIIMNTETYADLDKANYMYGKASKYKNEKFWVNSIEKDISAKSEEIKNLEKELNDLNKNIQTKIDNDVNYRNTKAYKNKEKIESLLKKAEKNKKENIDIVWQEWTTNKVVTLKPEYDYSTIILPFGKLLNNKNIWAKISSDKKAQDLLSPEEKNLTKTYWDFDIYPYNTTDIDLVSNVSSLNNFVIMSKDPFSLLCAKCKIESKLPEFEIVYERQEWNVAYFVKKKLTKEQEAEIQEVREDAASIWDSINNLSSYCSIK